jgi:hypothetical protein
MTTLMAEISQLLGYTNDAERYIVCVSLLLCRCWLPDHGLVDQVPSSTTPIPYLLFRLISVVNG